ncbi:MAG: response regulator [Candidatus Hydrogenedentota bacterium]
MAIQKTVLIIDDDPDMRYFCKQVLERAGYRVLTADNGAEGMNYAHTVKPDCVVLDIVMEKIDTGYTVADKLGPDVPILMISSILNESDQVVDSSRLPFREMLKKPIDAETLLDKVKKLAG